MNWFNNILHWNYLISQINLDVFYDTIYMFIYYYDVVSTKVLILLSYSNMLSDLAEGFAVSLILLILLTSSILLSIKVQDSSKANKGNNLKLSPYKTIFTFFK